MRIHSFTLNGLMIVLAVSSFILTSQAAIAQSYHFVIPHKVLSASSEEPELTSPDCYYSANIGTIGAWPGCEGLLIVENENAPYGIRTAFKTGIEHPPGSGIMYGPTDIFTGQVTQIVTVTFDSGDNFNGDIGYWDTSNMTSMYGAFQFAPEFNQDISGWDTSKVTDMDLMFLGSNNFNQDISGWNTSSLVRMRNMFYEASAFNQDIGLWDTSKVIDMYGVFAFAGSFDQDISGWNVSSVLSETRMQFMFYEATSFNQDLSNWCVPNVPSLPNGFHTNTVAWEPKTNRLPQWNTTCP